MKGLKTFILVAILLLGGMAFTGCEDSNASNNQQVANTQNKSDSTVDEKALDSEEKKAFLDSINIVNNRLDDIFTKIESQRIIIEKNQSCIMN